MSKLKVSALGGIEQNSIGKFTLIILLIVITLLAYSKAEAAEIATEQADASIFETSAATSELKEMIGLIEEVQSPAPEENEATIVETASIIDEELKEDITQELAGTRMEPMIDTIASYDRTTAALLVGVAKSESGYTHNYSYNFWGYAGGYYPFNSPEQAVKVVGDKLEQYKCKGLDTPQKLVTTWKCGRSCASHSPESVKRWISNASGPYYRIAMATEK